LGIAGKMSLELDLEQVGPNSINFCLCQKHN